MNNMTENTPFCNDEQLAQLLTDAQHHERQRLLRAFSKRLSTLAGQVSRYKFNCAEAAELLSEEAEKFTRIAGEEMH